jgi:hypothetical protein
VVVVVVLVVVVVGGGGRALVARFAEEHAASTMKRGREKERRQPHCKMPLPKDKCEKSTNGKCGMMGVLADGMVKNGVFR